MKKPEKKDDNTPKFNKFTYYLCEGTEYLHWLGIYSNRISELMKEKPTIVIFGGNATSKDSVSFTYAKTLKTLLGPFMNDVHMVTINYNDSINNEGELSRNINQFVSNVFVPMFTYDGAPVPVEQAQQNARQLTLMAHCYGVYEVLSNVEAVTHDVMLGLGYSKEEVASILSQIAVVTYGAASKLQYMSELNCVSITDGVKKADGASLWCNMLEDIDNVDMPSSDKAYLLKKYIKSKRHHDKKFKFLKKFISVNDRCYIHKVSDNKYFIASGHLTWESEHEWDNMCGDHLTTYMRLGDLYERYYAPTEAGKYVTRIVSSYICQSVANGMLNRTSDTFVPFDMSMVMEDVKRVVAPLNYSRELNLTKQDKFNMATNKYDDDMKVEPNKTDYPELFEKE